jgi:uncharacterized membrane protein YhaH (DUF805 family)
MEWMMMPLRRYADFRGRSCRSEYWLFQLLLVMVYAVLGIAGFAVAMGLGVFSMTSSEDILVALTHQPVLWLIIGIAGIFSLAVFIPSISVVVRRLHDLGLSGWWYAGYAVLSQVPYLQVVVFIGFLVVMCLKGTSGENKFGADPLDYSRVDVFS